MGEKCISNRIRSLQRVLTGVFKQKCLKKMHV
jgi:hypothetical protein